MVRRTYVPAGHPPLFTGIIEEVGRVRRTEDLGGGRRFRVDASMSTELRPDQSVAINGTCLTVTDSGEDGFTVTAVEETLEKTTLGALGPADPVNLERAVRPSDRLDGHLVQGHVDETGRVLGVRRETNSRLYRVSFDPSFGRFLIPVGSIAVDGISLTVARLEEEAFTVSIIPHTYEHTNVPTWREGTEVNLEYDLIGKYVARHLEIDGAAGERADYAPRRAPEPDSGPSGAESLSDGGTAGTGEDASTPSSEEEITPEWLREQGFV